MAGPMLRGSYALDGGVLLEMLLGTAEGGRVMESLASDSMVAYASEVNVSEAGYVLCRKLSARVASAKIRSLLQSNYLTILEGERLREIVVDLKCSRSLALADCYCLAAAKTTGSRALFAFKEEELRREMRRRPFDVEVTFLNDN